MSDTEVRWQEIDWSKDIHKMSVCPCCGIDADEFVGMGHGSSCYYGNGSELAGAEEFFREEIRKALIRERAGALPPESLGEA